VCLARGHGRRAGRPGAGADARGRRGASPHLSLACSSFFNAPARAGAATNAPGHHHLFLAASQWGRAGAIGGAPRACARRCLRHRPPPLIKHPCRDARPTHWLGPARRRASDADHHPTPHPDAPPTPHATAAQRPRRDVRAAAPAAEPPAPDRVGRPADGAAAARGAAPTRDGGGGRAGDRNGGRTRRTAVQPTCRRRHRHNGSAAARRHADGAARPPAADDRPPTVAAAARRTAAPLLSRDAPAPRPSRTRRGPFPPPGRVPPVVSRCGGPPPSPPCALATTRRSGRRRRTASTGSAFRVALSLASANHGAVLLKRWVHASQFSQENFVRRHVDAQEVVA